MKKNLLLLLLFPILAWAQSDAVKLKTYHFKNEYGTDYYFPVAVSENAKVAEKINAFLQVLILAHAPKAQGNPLTGKGNKINVGDLGGLTTTSWQRLPSTENILALQFDLEYCGAYCEIGRFYYNFDTKTGDLITLDAIFTPAGFKQLNQRYQRDFARKMKMVVRKVKTEIKKAISKGNAENKTRGEEHLSIYEDCLKIRLAYGSDLGTAPFFYLAKESLLLKTDRCTNHASRALDDYEYEYNRYRYTYQSIKNYLTPYGASLLGNGDQFVKNSALTGKMFKGRIGEYPVTALIERVGNDNSFNLYYWYDKYKKLIRLSGSRKTNHFSLTEYAPDDGSHLVAHIQAKWQDGKILGTWTSAENADQKLRLELIEY